MGVGAGAGLGGWGRLLEPAWEERLSLTEGGEGNRGIAGGSEGFFLLEGGTRGGGRDMGTCSPSRALYTRYMAWERAATTTTTKINDNRQLPIKLRLYLMLCYCVLAFLPRVLIVPLRDTETIFPSCNSLQQRTVEYKQTHLKEDLLKEGVVVAQG